MKCLVTGATGYIGGRLVPGLLDAGHEIRCMVRSAGRLRDQPWASRVEIAEADEDTLTLRAPNSRRPGARSSSRSHRRI